MSSAWNARRPLGPFRAPIPGKLATVIPGADRGIRNTLAEARSRAYSAVNSAMVEAYWEIGRQIDETVGERAEYGKRSAEIFGGAVDFRVW